MKLAFRGALTEPFAVSGEKIGVLVPAGWTAADMTFQVSHDRVSFFDLYGYDGSAVTEATSTVAENTAISLAGIADHLAPFQWARIRSGVSATPAYQGAVAASKVFTFDTGKTLTVTSGAKGMIGNELSFSFETNEKDDLELSVSGAHTTIKLASDTSSKNSAAAIQALIQAATISDIDVTALTVAESSGYAAARPAATKAVAVISFADAEETAQGALTLTAGIGGAGGNFVSNTSWGANLADELSVSVNALGNIEIMLASTTASNNTAAAIQAAIRDITGTDFDEFLAAMTVTADATWTATPVTGATFFTNGLVTEGSAEGADIVVPDGGNLAGGDRFEIELSVR
jgi:hypothetical protein